MSQNNQVYVPDTRIDTRPLNSAEMDRISHDSDSFFYKYRWCIVLILAILLAYYLYTKRWELGIMPNTTTKLPAIGATELNISPPAVINVNTEGRNMFGI